MRKAVDTAEHKAAVSDFDKLGQVRIRAGTSASSSGSARIWLNVNNWSCLGAERINIVFFFHSGYMWLNLADYDSIYYSTYQIECYLYS